MQEGSISQKSSCCWYESHPSLRTAQSSQITRSHISHSHLPATLVSGAAAWINFNNRQLTPSQKKNKPIAQMFARSPTARGVVAGDLRHGGTHSTFLVTPTHLKFKMAHCRSAHEKSFHRLVCLCKKNTNFLGNSGSTLNTGSMLKVNLYTLCQLCFVTY